MMKRTAMIRTITKQLCAAAVLAGMLALWASAIRAADPLEGSLPASEVRGGNTILDWTADKECVVSGFYLRLTNCVPPREEPVVAAMRLNGQTLPERVEIPIFPRPLRLHSLPFNRSPQTYPPLDVAREFRRALAEPKTLREGDRLELVIVSTGEMASGVTAGVQFQGVYPLASMRNPFRDCRTCGPVCQIPWSQPEVIAVGTGKQFDPQCAPQNNSSVIDDADGTLYQFTAYYSVDEQYGGGRDGSYSRIYGFKKAPGADHWEPMGLVVDLFEGETYSGDPYVFRDLDGRPSMYVCTCDGTKGFIDWEFGDALLIQSETDSFAGPWGKPTYLWKDYPQKPDDNKNGGRANCVRIFPRPETGDYMIVWNHGSNDMDFRYIITDDLKRENSHRAVGDAEIVSINQEEGGGGFTYAGKGYLSTWQIPWLNDPSGVQRLYEFDLTEPFGPESVRIVPGSVGCNDGTDQKRDGGCTADAWAVSVAGGRLWATSCEYSKTENKNYLLARSAPIDPETLFPRDGVFRYGAVYSWCCHEVFPTVEYAVGKQAALEMDFVSRGEKSYAFIAVNPSDSPSFYRALFFEMNPDGCRLIANNGSYNLQTGGGEDNRLVLAEDASLRWEPEKKYHLCMERDGDRITVSVDGGEVFSVTIDDPEILANLDDDPRFELYGWEGGYYEISNAVLSDGPAR
ncbi:MAG: hypothetical protein IJG02_06975 [Thermoguttaceae bacterium]|nr:hypothetical protein [Thermoguttaceae bacterium]